MAAEFLHHVAYVNIDDISFKERVERYDVMGDLYQQLKFNRKAAFFKRVAAMHCVSPMLPSPSWSECYSLLLKSFPGFKMSFNASDYQVSGNSTGWSGIRVRVFHELIYAAKQLGNSAVIVRHVSLCLHTMFKYMQANEIHDLILLLETCTKDNRDDGLPITTTTGVLLPPVAFSSFPLLRSFEVLKLPPQLEPHKQKQVLPSDSVFIYSPMNFTRQLSRSVSILEYEFGWVQGNPGSVEVSLYNPLSMELKLTDLSLIVDGVKFQSFPSSHTLPAESGPHSITIMGIPRSHGTLKILGYQMTLFGVVSRCIFSELAHIRQKVFTVNVAPSLPMLHISSELPKSPYMVTGGDNAIVTSAILQIYVGEQRECQIMLKNNGPDAITAIDVMFESEKYQDVLGKVLELDLSSVSKSLPLQPDCEAALTIRTVGSLRLADLPEDTLMSPHGDHGEKKQRATTALIESLLKITYTGVEGGRLLYYRECNMAIDTVLIPSINIISKTVNSVDGESCLVGYEVFNESNMVLNIKSDDKTALLKPMQSDWVKYKVEKCDCSATIEDCMQCIDESVTLGWQSEERHRHGQISTDRLEWAPEELDKLRKRPFTVVGSVKKNSCNRYLLGDRVQLSYTISNISETNFTDVELCVLLCQDIASSKQEVELGTCYVYVGPSNHTIAQFDSGVTVQLDMAVAIFYSGQYTFECQCLHNGVLIPGVDPGLSIIVS